MKNKIIQFVVFVFLNTFLCFSQNNENIHSRITLDSIEILTAYNPKLGYIYSEQIFHSETYKKRDDLKGRLLYLIGNSVGNMHKYTEAFKYLEFAKKEALKTKDNYLLLRIDFSNAIIYSRLNNYEKAIEIIDKGLKKAYLIKNNDNRNHFIALSISKKTHLLRDLYPNLSISYSIKNYNKANYYLSKLKFKKRYNFTYHNIASVYLENKDYEKAKKYFFKALSIKYKSNFLKGIIFTDLSQIYLKVGDINNSIKYSKMALALFNKDYYYIETNYNYLSTCFSIKGMKKLSEEYKRKEYIYNDSLNIRDLKEKTVATNYILKKLELEYKEKTEDYIFIKIVAVLMSVVFLVIIVVYRKYYSKKIKVKEEQLSTSTIEIIDLKHKVTETYNDLIDLAKSDSPLFTPLFEELYPDFVQKLLIVQPNLTLTEKKICFFLKLKFTTKEIATYTYVSIKAIQNRKNRLRKRLGMENSEDLYDWIENL